MKILLINPPYQTITSNFGVGHQIPLGLLMVGGPLLRDGHHVRLLDAECCRLSITAIVKAVDEFQADIVMTGHAGSTPAHPICMEMLRAVKRARPETQTIYGGVYPSYHAEKILAEEPAVDFVIKGEGEATVAELVAHLAGQTPVAIHDVKGISYRCDGSIRSAPPRPPIRDLDALPIAWSLIENWDAHGCFGLGRAAIIQFSRGCPHRCTYCGQHKFWERWRHRDPIKVVEEIQWLHQTHGIRFITLADENPTTSPKLWRAFLEELAGRKLDVHFFATIRATDIVRDAQILPLYRQAGILYVLMGIESTSDDVLKQIRKGSTSRHDYQACRLLKQNGIFSVLGHIVGLQDETPATFASARKQLAEYDGDWLNAMYVTPHDWTGFGRETAGRAIVDADQRHWDYRHQILAQKYLTPAQIFWRVKWLELYFHLRPRRLRQIFAGRDTFRRKQQLWTLFHCGLVWFAELVEFIWGQMRLVASRPTIEASTPRPIRQSTALTPSYSHTGKQTVSTDAA